MLLRLKKEYNMEFAVPPLLVSTTSNLFNNFCVVGADLKTVIIHEVVSKTIGTLANSFIVQMLDSTMKYNHTPYKFLAVAGPLFLMGNTFLLQNSIINKIAEKIKSKPISLSQMVSIQLLSPLKFLGLGGIEFPKWSSPPNPNNPAKKP